MAAAKTRPKKAAPKKAATKTTAAKTTAAAKAAAKTTASAKAAAKTTAAAKAAASKTASARTTAARAKPVKVVDQRFQRAKRASILLKHVSDPTRLQVILILSEGERHVGALCEQLSQSQPAVSHHLALLRHGNIIAPRRQGKNNFYSLTEAGTDLARVVKGLLAP